MEFVLSNIRSRSIPVHAVGNVTIASLVTTAVFAVFSLIVGLIVLGKGQPRIERWVISWLTFDVLIHFLLEGPFVVISLTSSVNNSEHFTSYLWKEYGKADLRWLHADPTVVSLEILTVVLDGLLCLVVIWGILGNAYYRHFAQVVLCVCELYGGWMTFCPEWLTGSKNLDTSNFMFLWVYLVFFNGLWVVLPLLLLYQSYEAMRTAFSAQIAKAAAAEKRAGSGNKDRKNLRSRKEK